METAASCWPRGLPQCGERDRALGVGIGIGGALVLLTIMCLVLKPRPLTFKVAGASDYQMVKGSSSGPAAWYSPGAGQEATCTALLNVTNNNMYPL